MTRDEMAHQRAEWDERDRKKTEAATDSVGISASRSGNGPSLKAIEDSARAYAKTHAEFMAMSEQERRAPGVPEFWKHAKAFRDIVTPEVVLALTARIAALEGIVGLADELINGGGLVNRGVDRGLVVVEKADKSDPHYRLCTALEQHKARALQSMGAGDV